MYYLALASLGQNSNLLITFHELAEEAVGKIPKGAYVAFVEREDRSQEKRTKGVGGGMIRVGVIMT